MQKFSKILATLVLVLSIVLLVACGKDNKSNGDKDNDDIPKFNPGEGVEGPIIPYD